MAQCILIISAQKLFSVAIRVLLEKEGFQVLDIMMPDDEALSHLSQLHFDILIVVEGDDVTGELPVTTRLLRRKANMPVIRVTLESDCIFIHKADQVQVRRSNLVAVIQELLAGKKSRVTIRRRKNKNRKSHQIINNINSEEV